MSKAVARAGCSYVTTATSRRGTSAAQVLAARAGTTLEKVARTWPTARPGLSAKELAGRVARIRRVVRHGDLPEQSARLLAALLKCPPEVFLHGWDAYQERVGAPSGATGKPDREDAEMRRPRARRNYADILRGELRLI